MAIGILIAAGIVVIGGLATGVAATIGTPSTYGPPATQLTGTFVEAGSEWVGPLFVLLLLAVLGLCWWQVETWGEETEDAENERTAEAVRHLCRAHDIVLWAQVGFGLSIAGAIAFFVGTLLVSTQSPAVALVWSRAIYSGAITIGAIVMAVVGLWSGEQLHSRFSATAT